VGLFLFTVTLAKEQFLNIISWVYRFNR